VKDREYVAPLTASIKTDKSSTIVQKKPPARKLLRALPFRPKYRVLFRRTFLFSFLVILISTVSVPCRIPPEILVKILHFSEFEWTVP
jgi:hypothetical protein